MAYLTGLTSQEPSDLFAQTLEDDGLITITLADQNIAYPQRVGYCFIRVQPFSDGRYFVYDQFPLYQVGVVRKYDFEQVTFSNVIRISAVWNVVGATWQLTA